MFTAYTLILFHWYRIRIALTFDWLLHSGQIWLSKLFGRSLVNEKLSFIHGDWERIIPRPSRLWFCLIGFINKGLDFCKYHHVFCTGTTPTTTTRTSKTCLMKVILWIAFFSTFYDDLDEPPEYSVPYEVNVIFFSGCFLALGFLFLGFGCVTFYLLLRQANESNVVTAFNRRVWVVYFIKVHPLFTSPSTTRYNIIIFIFFLDNCTDAIVVGFIYDEFRVAPLLAHNRRVLVWTCLGLLGLCIRDTFSPSIRILTNPRKVSTFFLNEFIITKAWIQTQ